MTPTFHGEREGWHWVDATRCEHALLGTIAWRAGLWRWFGPPCDAPVAAIASAHLGVVHRAIAGALIEAGVYPGVRAGYPADGAGSAEFDKHTEAPR